MSFWTRPAGIALIYAAFAAAWILGSDALLALAIPDPALSFRIAVIKGLAFVALSGAMLYALLRSSVVKRTDAAADTLVPPIRKQSRRTLILLLLLVLTVPLVAAGVFTLNRMQSERDSFEDLKAIASLKSTQIANWFAERHSDAATLMESRGFIERVERMQRDQDARERELIRDRLTTLQKHFGYESILLVDPGGVALIQAGVPSNAQAHDVTLVSAALADGEVKAGELYRDASGNLHLDFVAPLLLDANGMSQPVGAVLLHVNPNDFLYPLINAWPVASPSGETFLVRRDGASLLYINELRHRPGTALTLRAPLASPLLPGAEAAREGRPGSLAGVDYRGVDVLAAWQPVPGTDWHLVAKVDRAEAIAPARQLALWVGLMTLVAVTVVVASMLALVHEQRRAENLALQNRTDRLTKLFFDLPFIGMAITSPGTRHWLQFNDHLCDMFGYSREELSAKSWTEMTHPDDLDRDVAQFERVLRGEIEGYVLDKRFIRKDGSLVHTTIDIKCQRNQDGSVQHFFCMVQDVTGRKAAEEKILNISRLYATLSRCNNAIVHSDSEQELFAEVCNAAVESAGMKMAWIGMVDDAGWVRPLASAGAGTGYLEGIRISVRADDPHGRGPTGTAIREQQAFWCQDFCNEPITAPWHERGREYGWGSSASLPLYRDGGVAVGALTLYVGHANAFDEQTQKLLLEMAQDISFALGNFRREVSRRRAEQALIESERQHRLLFDNSLDAVLLTAPDGRILAANPAACRMFGMTQQEIIALGRDGIVDVSDPNLPVALEERSRTGKFIGEMTFVRRDGERFPGEVSTSVFQDSDGNARTSMFIRDITERRRAGELTRALLEQLEFYLKASPVVSYALSTDRKSTRSVWVSENIQRMAGYTPQEALAPDWWAGNLHPEDRDRAMEEIRAAVAGTGFPRIEYRFRHKDGHYIWVLDTFQPLPGAGGRGTQVIGAWNDITTEKQLQESLSASEERFRVMFEQAPLGIALIDSLDGRIYEVNRKFAEIAGRTREEMARVDWQSITHPDDIQADLDNMALMNAGKLPGFSMKKRYLKPDGTVVWIHLTVTPIQIATGAGPRHLAMIEDITANERMIRTLEDQEARFRALAEQSMVGIYTLDQGKVAYVNPRAADIYGYTPEEMAGRPAGDFVAPEDLERVRANMGRRMAGEVDDMQYEFAGLRKDGSRVMIGVHGSTAVIGGRRVLMGVMQDITEKLRAETEIQDYITRIERMISGAVNAISTMVELRDPYTAGHERRVGQLSAAIAQEMGLDAGMQRGLLIAGAVHDVGKIAVPAEILSKPGRLTPAEFEMVKAHAQQGYEVLRGIESLWPIAEVARQHHERIDGSGYPRGLKGGEILLEARILAVADVVESMGSHRPYRPMLGIDTALDEIERNAGKLYDAQAAAACLRLFREKGYVLPA